MEDRNQAVVLHLFLLGLTDDPDLQPLMFSIFLSIYLATIFENLLVIMTVITESHLQTPMHFVLSKLSFADICLSPTTIPNVLVNKQA
jgi:olfactory receptor